MELTGSKQKRRQQRALKKKEKKGGSERRQVTENQDLKLVESRSRAGRGGKKTEGGVMKIDKEIREEVKR